VSFASTLKIKSLLLFSMVALERGVTGFLISGSKDLVTISPSLLVGNLRYTTAFAFIEFRPTRGRLLFAEHWSIQEKGEIGRVGSCHAFSSGVSAFIASSVGVPFAMRFATIPSFVTGV